MTKHDTNKTFHNRVHIIDEESKFPFCASSNKVSKLHFLAKILGQADSTSLSYNLFQSFCKSRHINIYEKTKINLKVFKFISIYNYNFKINILSSRSLVISSIIEICSKSNRGILLRDIKYFKRFSTISGRAILDVFTAVISDEREHINKNFKRCLSRHFTHISKLFTVSIKTRLDFITSIVVMTLEFFMHNIIVYYFSFAIIT